MCDRPHVPRDPKKPAAAKDSLNLVGPQVRRLRTASRWSQTDLAATCQRQGWDAGRDVIARIEAGNRQVTDHELVVLARVLGCTVAELIGEAPLPTDADALSAQLSARRVLRAGSVVSGLLPVP